MVCAASVLVLAAGIARASRSGSASDPTLESAASATVPPAGQELIATGGYQFTIPADFNGGIFGTTTPIVNRVTFNAKRAADGTVSGWYTYEQAYDGQVFNFSDPVTCLRIYDTPVLTRTPEVPPLVHNRTKWGGRVEASTDPAQALADTLPLGRLITPDEVADAVVFLAGNESLTGSVLALDGGSTAGLP